MATMRWITCLSLVYVFVWSDAQEDTGDVASVTPEKRQYFVNLECEDMSPAMCSAYFDVVLTKYCFYNEDDPTCSAYTLKDYTCDYGGHECTNGTVCETAIGGYECASSTLLDTLIP